MEPSSENPPRRLSSRFESLFGLTDTSEPSLFCDPDTVVIGSGYGAAFAALGLVERGAKNIWVLERGNEFVPGEFPPTFGAVPGQVSVTTSRETYGYPEGLWDVRQGKGMTAVLGRGLGGGSLVNASVAFEIDPKDLATWPRPEGVTREQFEARFVECRKRVSSLLGVTTHSGAASLSKFQALEHLASRLGDDCRVEPAPLTVRFRSGKNQVGVHQAECINCGNCVSGCNVGAKGSLDMNLWPLLVSRGVRILTGVTVRALHKPDESAKWHISACATRTAKLEKTISARRVILAAGSLGSTEILARSEKLSLSRGQLGRGFSGNGDHLGFSQGTPQKVRNAAARPSVLGQKKDPQVPLQEQVGPTIVGYVRVPERAATQGNEPHRPAFLLEDGAIPFPAKRFVEEIAATQNVLRYLSEGTLPSWLDGGLWDPAAGTGGGSDHHPVTLVMGRSSSVGRLKFEGDAIVPEWPAADAAPKNEFFRGVRAALRGAALSVESGEPAVFLDPPEGPIRELRGETGPALTVHPLGGCRMALTAEEGVVSPRGEVFSGADGREVHDGLYVLDGSIFPTDIGVNPFLTIATFAYQLAREIPPVTADRVKVDEVSPEWAHRGEPRSGAPVPHPDDEGVGGEFRERLFVRLSASERKRVASILSLDATLKEALLAPSKGDLGALVVDATIKMPDAYEWLKNPNRELSATFSLSVCSVDFGDTVPTTALVPLFQAPGFVNLGGLDRAEGLLRFFRGVRLFSRFLALRGIELWRAGLDTLSKALSRGHSPRPQKSLFASVKETFQSLIVLARVQADYRFLSYRFESGDVRFSGRKDLAYRGAEPDPLRILTKLPFTLEGARGVQVSSELEVDLIRLTDQPAALQLDRTPDSPTSAVALLSLGLFFGRAVISSLFWSFKRPVYERFGTKEQENTPRLAEPPPRLIFAPEKGDLGCGIRDVVLEGRFAAKAAEDPRGPDVRRARVVRYRHPSGHTSRKTALLIHGLAHGSRVFTTDTIKMPMASALLGQGYDVWLLDHSLSTTLEREPDPEINMDDLAAEDIPWAVSTIVSTNRSEGTTRGLDVFAHCIGAGAFAMSVLGGKLKGQPIHSVVIHAVTPWLIGSRDNRWRANALALYKDRLTMGYFDPIPHSAPSAPESLYDALAGSFSWGEHLEFHEEHDRGDAFSRTVCNRMTLFYGEEWVHDNLAPATHRDIATLVGPGSLEVMRQAHSCVVRGRLTDNDGRSPYVLRENFEKFWDFPTRFVHGSENCVFRAEASKRSAWELGEIFQAYEDRPVSVQIIDGYGHMDVIFGKDAHRDVYPKIYEFFENPRSDLDGTQYLPSPYSSVANVSIPQVGPIISLPRVEAGRVRFRIWATTNQLAHTSPESIAVPGLDRIQVRRKAARLGEELRREFWVGEAEAAPACAQNGASGGFFPTPGGAFAERVPRAVSVAEMPWYRRLERGETEGAVSFLVGSCLHPGLGSERQRSDSVFEAMRDHLKDRPEGRGVDHLLLLGDLIYADATGELLDPHAAHERFRKRYKDALGGLAAKAGQHAHFVMSHLPTYFSIDDHEIHNDWQSTPGVLLTSELRNREENALDSAYDFLIHREREGEQGRFWYEFESGGASFFVFDTRTERLGNVDRANVRALINEEQQAGFRAWIARQRDSESPIFFSTGSSLIPITKARAEAPELTLKEDGLLGYTGFLAWLTSELQPVRARRIVWLSGDVHSSSCAELELRLPDKDPVSVIGIASSGLFAPLPFINTASRSYVHKDAAPPVEVQTGALTISSRQYILVEDCVSSFVRVDWIDGSIRVQGLIGGASRGARSYVRTF